MSLSKLRTIIIQRKVEIPKVLVREKIKAEQIMVLIKDYIIIVKTRLRKIISSIKPMSKKNKEERR